MGEKTKIAWCDSSWNPWLGCSKVSEGCANCYAARTARRNPAVFGSWGPEGSRVVAAESTWKEPLAWDRAAAKAGVRRRVFCGSMCDVFEDWPGRLYRGGLTHRDVLFVDASGKFVSFPASTEAAGTEPSLRCATLADVRSRLFRTSDATTYLDWLLCTKRPGNIIRMWPDPHNPWPGVSLQYRYNVWLLTSCENQEMADRRVPELLNARDLSPVLGLSCEPLLSALDLSHVANSAGFAYGLRDHVIDWVICGCEQLSNHRPGRNAEHYADHARDLLAQCRAAGVPFFHKQMPVGGRVSGDMTEWPEDLRVQEYPQ